MPVNHRSNSRGLIRGSRRSCTTRRLYFVAYKQGTISGARTNPIIPPTNQWPNANHGARTSHLLCGPSGSSGNCLELELQGGEGDKLFAEDRIHACASSIYIYIYIYRVFFSFFFLIRREIGQIKIRSEVRVALEFTRFLVTRGSNVLTRDRIFFFLFSR